MKRARIDIGTPPPLPCFFPSSVCSSSSNVTPASVVLLSTSFSTLPPPPPLLSPLPPFTQLMPRYTGMPALPSSLLFSHTPFSPLHFLPVVLPSLLYLCTSSSSFSSFPHSKKMIKSQKRFSFFVPFFSSILAQFHIDPQYCALPQYEMNLEMWWRLLPLNSDPKRSHPKKRTTLHLLFHFRHICDISNEVMEMESSPATLPSCGPANYFFRPYFLSPRLCCLLVSLPPSYHLTCPLKSIISVLLLAVLLNCHAVNSSCCMSCCCFPTTAFLP